MKLPDKGRDVIAKDSNGEIFHLYRCNCIDDKCAEWRCGVTGGMISVNIISWEYE